MDAWPLCLLELLALYLHGLAAGLIPGSGF
jgi:hypothetical protein